MHFSLLQLACSGLGVEMMIAESTATALLMYVIAWVMVLALAYDAWRLGFIPKTLPWAAVLLIVHPAIWMHGLNRDCVPMKGVASVWVTCLIGGILALYALLTFGGHPDLPTLPDDYRAAPDPSDADTSVQSPPKSQ